VNQTEGGEKLHYSVHLQDTQSGTEAEASGTEAAASGTEADASGTEAAASGTEASILDR
jgi:hypothetical protein